MSGTGNREESVFHAAMELPTPEARAAYLREACGGDDQLRQRVKALLQAVQFSNDFLEQPAAPLLASAEQPGDRIGLYKLLEQIGEGSMGNVGVGGGIGNDERLAGAQRAVGDRGNHRGGVGDEA